MLEWVIKTAKDQEVFKFVHLHVVEYNAAALKLYQGLGFKELEVFKDFYNIDQKLYAGILLGLFINDGRRKLGWG